jgi:Rrf2 family protein
MDLSKTTRYAIRLMSYMASSGVKSHSSADLNLRLGIPRQYLRQLLTRLTKKELLHSDKGRTGGFTLARSANRIFLSEVIAATDETPLLQSCVLGFENCQLAGKCYLHDKWTEARQKMIGTFQSISLADMNIKIKYS